MIEFGEANHVPAAAAAIAVEEVFVGVHQEAWLVISVQRAQPHQSTAAEGPRRLPIMSLQIAHQGNLLFQLVERLDGSRTSCLDGQNTADRAEIPGKDGGRP